MAVALLILAISAGMLAYEFPDLSQIVGFSSMSPKGSPTKATEAAELQARIAEWNTPALWNEPASKRELFDSKEYLFYPSAYPAGEYIKAVNDDIRSPSGILLSWYKKNGLDFQDSNVDREDPDGDGFSNIVEYRNEQVGERLKAADCDGTKSTNPHDPKSHPDYLARLRLQKYETVPFHIQFRGINTVDGVNFFQIVLKDVPADKQPGFKKTGDQLGFEGYVIGPYVHNIVTVHDKATNTDEQVDKSTLELDRPDIGLKVIVGFKEEKDSPDSTADFVMLMPNESDKVLKVAQGKILTLSYLPGRKFLLLEANDSGARIQDMDSKQEYHILKLDPAEWDEVPAAAK